MAYNDSKCPCGGVKVPDTLARRRNRQPYLKPVNP